MGTVVLIALALIGALVLLKVVFGILSLKFILGIIIGYVIGAGSGFFKNGSDST